MIIIFRKNYKFLAAALNILILRWEFFLRVRPHISLDLFDPFFFWFVYSSSSIRMILISWLCIVLFAAIRVSIRQYVNWTMAIYYYDSFFGHLLEQCALCERRASEGNQPNYLRQEGNIEVTKKIDMSIELEIIVIISYCRWWALSHCNRIYYWTLWDQKL